MGSEKPVVLAVDDEPLNLEILSRYIKSAGYDAELAEDGAQALAMLSGNADRYSAIVLDRMMPNVDGMTVMAEVKATPDLMHIPIIMQTAKAAKDDILEGLKKGAQYYITKPFEKDAFITMLKAAVSGFVYQKSLRDEINQTSRTLALMNSGYFEFQTLQQSKELAALLANASSEPERVVLGLSELLTNAIEHGNLEISYDDKTSLVEQDNWAIEVEKRLNQPEFKERRASIEIQRTNSELRFIIRDEGKGFDWQRFVDLDPERAFDNHGRGIITAKMFSFDGLEYRGNGNEVIAVISLQ
jgi:CheY-like chemotaxis protein